MALHFTSSGRSGRARPSPEPTMPPTRKALLIQYSGRRCSCGRAGKSEPKPERPLLSRKCKRYSIAGRAGDEKAYSHPQKPMRFGNAAPNAQFQALVEALSRKGIVSAADLSANANPATTNYRPRSDSACGSRTVSASLSGPETSAQAQTSPSHLCPRGSRARGLP